MAFHCVHVYTRAVSHHSAAVGGAVLAKYRALTSLKTKGLGPQNLTSNFLMFSWREPSSRHHLESSAADGPAVGSKMK